jgi:predicted TIM-barrel fold metal-dependent hydrolase
MQMGPRLWRTMKDDEAYRAAVRAYNDWLGEEYCAVSRDRLIGLGVIPWTNLDDAVAELEHCAKLGLKGVNLGVFPSGKGYPTPEDDKFWAAALDLNMPLTNHSDGNLGSGGGQPDFLYPKEPGPDIHQKNAFRFFTRFTNPCMIGPLQMAFAGVWDRFPDLKFYWAETMIGWLEYGLWQIDDHYDRYIGMINDHWGLNRLERRPSEYIKEHNYWGFLHDPVGVKRRECIGADKLIWGTDFAHAASEWPNSIKVMEQDFAEVPEKEKCAMLVDNCVRYFELHD